MKIDVLMTAATAFTTARCGRRLCQSTGCCFRSCSGTGQIGSFGQQICRLAFLCTVVKTARWLVAWKW